MTKKKDAPKPEKSTAHELAEVEDRGSDMGLCLMPDTTLNCIDAELDRHAAE